ncbi:MAG: DUF4178 domain-containing protein [Myxococcota bacterium]|nr:DUF4178 domain-containing protein [Myxococcota bacterium]
MLKEFLVIILIAVAGWLVFSAFRRKNKNKNNKLKAKGDVNLADLRLWHARTGDIIEIRAAGDDFEDLSFAVDKRHRYETDSDVSFELIGTYKNQRIYLEYSEGDEGAVLLSTQPASTIETLGLNEEDLIRMDEAQSTAESFSFDGSVWRYALSGEVGFFENNASDGEGFHNGDGFYHWEFISEDGKRRISIEKWPGEPFEARLFDHIHPDDITIYRG